MHLIQTLIIRILLLVSSGIHHLKGVSVIRVKNSYLIILFEWKNESNYKFINVFFQKVKKCKNLQNYVSESNYTKKRVFKYIFDHFLLKNADLLKFRYWLIQFLLKFQELWGYNLCH